MEVLCFNQHSAETFQIKASAVCLVSLVTCHMHPGRKDKGLTQLRQFFKLRPSVAFREVRNGYLHPGDSNKSTSDLACPHPSAYHISMFPVSHFHCLEENRAARKGMIYRRLTSLIQAIYTRLRAHILFPRYE